MFYSTVFYVVSRQRPLFTIFSAETLDKRGQKFVTCPLTIDGLKVLDIPQLKLKAAPHLTVYERFNRTVDVLSELHVTVEYFDIAHKSPFKIHYYIDLDANLKTFHINVEPAELKVNITDEQLRLIYQTIQPEVSKITQAIHDKRKELEGSYTEVLNLKINQLCDISKKQKISSPEYRHKLKEIIALMEENGFLFFSKAKNKNWYLLRSFKELYSSLPVPVLTRSKAKPAFTCAADECQLIDAIMQEVAHDVDQTRESQRLTNIEELKAEILGQTDVVEKNKLLERFLKLAQNDAHLDFFLEQRANLQKDVKKELFRLAVFGKAEDGQVYTFTPPTLVKGSTRLSLELVELLDVLDYKFLQTIINRPNTGQAEQQAQVIFLNYLNAVFNINANFKILSEVSIDDLKEGSRKGHSLLWNAYAANNIELFKWLVNKGASLEDVNDMGESFLYAAVKDNKEDFAKVLLEAKCEVDPIVARMKLAVFAGPGLAEPALQRDIKQAKGARAIPRHTSDQLSSRALIREERALADKMKRDQVLEACSKGKQRTPLMEASKAGLISMIRLLLQYGADPIGLKDEEGYNAIEYLLIRPSDLEVPLDIFDVLKARGFDLNVQIGRSIPRTPLLICVHSDLTLLGRSLVAADADSTRLESIVTATMVPGQANRYQVNPETTRDSSPQREAVAHKRVELFFAMVNQKCLRPDQNSLKSILELAPAGIDRTVRHTEQIIKLSDELFLCLETPDREDIEACMKDINPAELICFSVVDFQLQKAMPGNFYEVAALCSKVQIYESLSAIMLFDSLHKTNRFESGRSLLNAIGLSGRYNIVSFPPYIPLLVEASETLTAASRVVVEPV